MYHYLKSSPDVAGGIIEVAGRKLVKAISFGAFDDDPDSVTAIEMRSEQSDVNGWISAWVEACWLLNGKPDGSPDPEATFVEDADIVADAIDGYANGTHEAASSASDESDDECAATPSTYSIMGTLVVERYHVSMPTLRRRLKKRDITDLRPAGHASNVPLLLDEREIARLWPKR